MCTVIYLPLKDKTIISSTRDESPARKKALAPLVHYSDDLQILYPADGFAGGTWIGITNYGDFAVLMNGGFINHQKAASYKKSRGLIVTDLLKSKNAINYWLQVDLNQVEPFTIIVFTDKVLYRFVWTGNEKHTMHPDPALPHIWSSATLYNENIRAKREAWFAAFTAGNENDNSESLLHFLKSKHEKSNEDDFVMNRNEMVKTCSISIVEMEHDKATFDYFDLSDNSKQTSTLAFKANAKTSLISAS